MNIIKTQDINSIGFTRAATGTGGPQNMVIEVKTFAPGAATPYYSIKLTGIRVSSYQVGFDASNFGLIEQIVITPTIYGYKDWVNNKSFAYNVSNNQPTTY